MRRGLISDWGPEGTGSADIVRFGLLTRAIDGFEARDQVLKSWAINGADGKTRDDHPKGGRGSWELNNNNNRSAYTLLPSQARAFRVSGVFLCPVAATGSFVLPNHPVNVDVRTGRRRLSSYN